MTMVQRTVLESDSIEKKDVYLKLRFEIPEEVMGRLEIEAAAEQSVRIRDQAKFPVERARLALDIREGELRADVLDALALVDISNPRDCRDVYELHHQVGGSSGEPSLRNAIDFLGTAGIDEAVVGPLAARLLELYPEDADE